jgi:hypothetical protein
LNAGGFEGVVVTFRQEAVRMPPHELALCRAAASFPARVAAAPTLPRELRAQDAYRLEPVLTFLAGDPATV